MQNLARYMITIVTAVIIGACSSGGWSAEERSAMLESCEGGFAGEKTPSGGGFCECVVDYLSLRYSLDEVDGTTIDKAARACR